MYSESYVKDEKIIDVGNNGLKTVPDYLKYYAEELKENEAMVFTSAECTSRDAVSWKMLYEKSCSAARSLVNMGVKEKELVAINLRTCPEWLYVTFGAMMAGAIPVTIAFVYEDGSDIIEVMKRLERCSVLVMDPGLEGENLRILKKLVNSCNDRGEVKCEQMPYLRNLLVHDPLNVAPEFKCKRLDDLRSEKNDEAKLPLIDELDVAILLQTSGSTGTAKLVAHTHKSILMPCKVENTGYFSPDHVFFNDRPFTWIGGFPVSCLIGQKRVTICGFRKTPQDSISEMIEVIDREKCSLVFALPPLLHAIMKKKDNLPRDWPVEMIITGGQPLTRSIVSSIGSVCKSLCCGYGSTEFIFMSLLVVDDPETFTEYACGKVITGPGLDVKIVDDNEQIVPVNTRGEIYLRSPGLFKGYFNDSAKTYRVKSKDGWYRTDDLGRMTEDGLFFIDGRKSNMIISGGINILPEALEHLIKSCPGIESVVVVPIPDDLHYQLICACVIPKPGSGLSAIQVQTFCEGLHNDKKGVFTVLPKFYLLFEKFPETNTGKTSRAGLARIAAALVKNM